MARFDVNFKMPQLTMRVRINVVMWLRVRFSPVRGQQCWLNLFMLQMQRH